jgi:hypothetical protein
MNAAFSALEGYVWKNEPTTLDEKHALAPHERDIFAGRLAELNQSLTPCPPDVALKGVDTFLSCWPNFKADSESMDKTIKLFVAAAARAPEWALRMLIREVVEGKSAFNSSFCPAVGEFSSALQKKAAMFNEEKYKIGKVLGANVKKGHAAKE